MATTSLWVETYRPSTLDGYVFTNIQPFPTSENSIYLKKSYLNNIFEFHKGLDKIGRAHV